MNTLLMRPSPALPLPNRTPPATQKRRNHPAKETCPLKPLPLSLSKSQPTRSLLQLSEWCFIKEDAYLNNPKGPQALRKTLIFRAASIPHCPCSGEGHIKFGCLTHEGVWWYHSTLSLSLKRCMAKTHKKTKHQNIVYLQSFSSSSISWWPFVNN